MTDPTVPFTPADPKPLAIPTENPLTNPAICRAVIAAIMVKANVQSLTLSQDEFVAVARLVLLDGRAGNGDFLLALGMRDHKGTVHPFDPTITQGH